MAVNVRYSVESRIEAWPEGFASQDFVVVDVETTGGSPRHDRVIEVAAVRVRAGRAVNRWHTLIDPGVPVPPFITGLTGITTGAVARAPTFAEVASRLQGFVGDAILVAHHATFDAGFLRQEFFRAEQGPFAPPILCTLRLSRRLFPGLASYSLDALVHAFGLQPRRYHRALPDALATAELFDHVVRTAAATGVGDPAGLRAVMDGNRRRGRTRAYEVNQVRELPSGPGVYLLKDGDENVFYVGKSVNVRRRVRDHLRGGAGGQRPLRRQLKRLATVQAIPTESELDALLLEARLIKRYLPVANQHLRDDNHYPFIRIDVQNPFPRIELTRHTRTDGALYFGPFRSARLVGHVVDYVRSAFGIRDCAKPNLPDGQPCILLELKKCLGPCIGAVSQGEYRGAVDRAAELLRGEWPDVVKGLEARMVHLAEQKRFEEAADLRDALDGLRQIGSAQQRLSGMGHFHAVIATCPSPPTLQLFFIRGGRLAHQARVRWPEEGSALAALCRRVFKVEDPAPLDRETVDEAWILASWVRQHATDPSYAIVEVAPSHLPTALRSVRAELERLQAERHRPPVRSRGAVGIHGDEAHQRPAL